MPVLGSRSLTVKHRSDWSCWGGGGDAVHDISFLTGEILRVFGLGDLKFRFVNLRLCGFLHLR